METRNKDRFLVDLFEALQKVEPDSDAIAKSFDYTPKEDNEEMIKQQNKLEQDRLTKERSKKFGVKIKEAVQGIFEAFEVTDELVGQLLAELDIDPEAIPMEELKKGLKVEQEHEDITKGDKLITLKIALAHLKELPDYYTRLTKMEQAAQKPVTDVADDKEAVEKELAAEAKPELGNVEKPELGEEDIKKDKVVVEAQEEKYTVLAKGISAKEVADGIAVDKKGVVAPDKDDPAKFMVILKEAKGNDPQSFPSIDIDDLGEENTEEIRNITDVKDVEVVGNEWYDDHILCFGVKFKDQAGKEWKLALWWAGPSVFGYAENANDSLKAKKNFIEHLHDSAAVDEAKSIKIKERRLHIKEAVEPISLDSADFKYDGSMVVEQLQAVYNHIDSIFDQLSEEQKEKATDMMTEINSLIAADKAANAQNEAREPKDTEQEAAMRAANKSEADAKNKKALNEDKTQELKDALIEVQDALNEALDKAREASTIASSIGGSWSIRRLLNW